MPRRLLSRSKASSVGSKGTSRRHHTMRKTKKRQSRKHKGGFFGEFSNIGSTVGQGLKEGVIRGFKQAPQEVFSSLRSKGSSYLQPSGSIANYAGNNIQNIIAGHHAELGREVGKTLRAIKNTRFNNQGLVPRIQGSILNPYLSKSMLTAQQIAKNQRKFSFNSPTSMPTSSSKPLLE